MATSDLQQNAQSNGMNGSSGVDGHFNGNNPQNGGGHGVGGNMISPPVTPPQNGHQQYYRAPQRTQTYSKPLPSMGSQNYSHSNPMVRPIPNKPSQPLQYALSDPVHGSRQHGNVQ